MAIKFNAITIECPVCGARQVHQDLTGLVYEKDGTIERHCIYCGTRYIIGWTFDAQPMQTATAPNGEEIPAPDKNEPEEVDPATTCAKPITEADWAGLIEKLQMLREEYKSIGAPGAFGYMGICSMLELYDDGDRSEALYRQMQEAK